MCVSHLVSFYGLQEGEVGHIRYSTMYNEDLAVNHRCHRQQAEDILQQLQNIPAMDLEGRILYA